jgi:hypothetical protein
MLGVMPRKEVVAWQPEKQRALPRDDTLKYLRVINHKSRIHPDRWTVRLRKAIASVHTNLKITLRLERAM